MLKYLKKFALDILPSLAATVIGAYIVNHYIIPSATTKTATAAFGSPDPKPVDAKIDAKATGSKAVEIKSDTKSDGALERSAFAKGVAEKSAIEKTAEKAAGRAPDSPDGKRKPSAREAKTPAKAQPVETTASLGETAPIAAEPRRDANDLARAALERARTNEPATAPEPLRTTVIAAPPHSTNSDVFNAGTSGLASSPRPVLQPARNDVVLVRPTPPGEIPAGQPVELHAQAGADKPSVAEDVINSAKSMFHAVIPR